MIRTTILSFILFITFLFSHTINDHIQAALFFDGNIEAYWNYEFQQCVNNDSDTIDCAYSY